MFIQRKNLSKKLMTMKIFFVSLLKRIVWLGDSWKCKWKGDMVSMAIHKKIIFEKIAMCNKKKIVKLGKCVKKIIKFQFDFKSWNFPWWMREQVWVFLTYKDMHRKELGIIVLKFVALSHQPTREKIWLNGKVYTN
jgi:hypothetical protein